MGEHHDILTARALLGSGAPSLTYKSTHWVRGPSAALGRLMGTKRKLDIEKLLQWTYRDELPKKIAGGREWLGAFGTLGTLIDAGNGEPGFPAALGEPHPDALVLDYKVRSLPDIKIDWRASRKRLMNGLARWTSDDDPILASMSVSARALVECNARMGTRPIWNLGQARVVRVMGKNNKPIVEGITPGRRYADGASCPLQLEPPAQEIACARFEYSVWHHALVRLAESCNLSDHVAVPPAAAPEPWLTGPEPTSRILKSILPPARQPVAV